MPETVILPPRWVQELSRKYTSGVAHMFLLHFNVADYVDHTNDLRSYLSKYLSGREILAFYNRAEGITFPLESIKGKFIQELGLSAPPDPALQALRSVQGGEEDASLPRDPGGALPLLEKLLKLEKKTAVILDFVETLVPEGDMSFLSPQDREALIFLQRWARDPVIMERGNLIILITRTLTDIHEALRAASSRIEAIEIPLPDYGARLSYIEYLETNGNLGIDTKEFARLTAGLSKIHIEDIKLRAEEEKEISAVEMVKERKKEIIKNEFADVIEILEPTYGFEAIGGMEQLKHFFQENLIKPLKSGDPELQEQAPIGVLLAGPPGVGKSYFCRAIAKESGINCIKFDLSKILGQYVGVSERNLSKALTCIKALAPTIVILEECDQVLQRGTGGGDSGVSSRIFGRLMDFIADPDNRGKVVFMANTNRPDLLDAALKRPGRLGDAIIPFLPPDEENREAVFKAVCDRRKIPYASYLDWKAYARRTDKYTHAELESIITKAWRTTRAGGGKELTPATMDHALDTIKSSTKDISLMTMLALAECTDKDLLPEQYKGKLDNKEDLDKEIQKIEQQRRKKREL